MGDAEGLGAWRGRSIFLFERVVCSFCSCVLLSCRWEGPDNVLREPRRFPRVFEGDSEDGGALVLRAYTGEVFRCEAAVDVVTKMFGGEVVCFLLIYMIYCLVYKCFVVVYFHYV